MECSICGHPGAHASVVPDSGMPARCPGCPICQQEAAKEAAQQEQSASTDE